MKVAFLVTHLLGTGHLARTAQIADAFAAAGHHALVLSGGMPAPLARVNQADFVQLPPVRSDADFSALYDDTGAVASEALLTAREMAIRDALHRFAPDVLVTELFPFGRRKLTRDFMAAIAATPGALTLTSIRDILQLPRKSGRKEEAEARLAQRYHGILFHGDSALVPLSDSWPLPETLNVPILETGYIGADTLDHAQSTGDGAGEVIVAAGGGAVGEALFRTALDAATRNPRQRWRVLVGGADPAERIAGLGQVAPNTRLEPARPDFRAVLSRCRIAVLQCGYNTAMDVIATGARAVFCPFEGTGETEQHHRARAMAARYHSGLLREADLTPDALLAAIETCTAAPPPDFSSIKRDGATRSVALVETALEARR